MRALIAGFLLFGSLGASAQISLPPCPADQAAYRHNCFGSFAYANGERYVGEFRNNKFHGQGTYTYPDGERYVGGWQGGSRHGQGIRHAANGSILGSGRWEDGRLVAADNPVTAQVASAVLPSGQHQAATSDSRQGVLPPCPTTGPKHSCYGSYSLPNGERYIGEFQNNLRDGHGTYIFPDGARYVGGFQSDLRHGQGIFWGSNGAVTLSGLWEKGRLAQSAQLDTTAPQLLTASSSGTDSRLEIERRKREESEARLAAEVQAERRKRQELEDRLAAAERQQTPSAQRPQAILRNERRLALVIGNSAYKINPLVNPANDATDIADSLTKVGFQTTLVQNATLSQMREATRRFADKLPSADVALIYFAGHGIESNRKNYLIPVNADLKFEYELAEQAYDAGVWLDMLESIKSTNTDRVNIVILDACRNNSLIGSRSIGRGLGKMDAPTGTFLAYSTAPGKVAVDGTPGDRNSPFTKHLLRAMQQPNLPIEEVFKEVRRNVGRETSGAQVPWESTSLTGHFTFRQAR